MRPVVSRLHQPFLGKSRSQESILSLGSSRLGLPFHVHGETWLATLAGTKRWFLLPPDAFPNRTDEEHLQMFMSPVPKWREASLRPVRLMSCTVRQGEAM